MVKLVKTGQAGSQNKGDLVVTVKPRKKGTGLKLNVTSSVGKLFGKSINNSVTTTLDELNVKDAIVKIKDDGALDYVIKARLEAAVSKAAGKDL
jgi:citrate lyase subunit gamma (acyl carrier protein)